MVSDVYSDTGVYFEIGDIYDRSDIGRSVPILIQGLGGHIRQSSIAAEWGKWACLPFFSWVTHGRHESLVWPGSLS